MDFRDMWESMDTANEVLENLGLQFKEIESAVIAIATCLGMRSISV